MALISLDLIMSRNWLGTGHELRACLIIPIAPPGKKGWTKAASVSKKIQRSGYKGFYTDCVIRQLQKSSDIQVGFPVHSQFYWSTYNHRRSRRGWSTSVTRRWTFVGIATVKIILIRGPQSMKRKWTFLTIWTIAVENSRYYWSSFRGGRRFPLVCYKIHLGVGFQIITSCHPRTHCSRNNDAPGFQQITDDAFAKSSLGVGLSIRM